MEVKTHKLEFGWELELPKDWTAETGENGAYMYYPPNDSTTLYATVFTAAGKDGGQPAPAEILEDFYVKSLGTANAEEIPLKVSEGLGCRAFYCVDDKNIHRIAAGIFTAGNLLSLNVYSESHDTVYKIADWFSNISIISNSGFNGG